MADDPDIAAVLALLREAREGRGWTPDDLGARLGVAGHTVEEWENGTKELRYVQYMHICAALGVDPAALIRAALRRR